MMRRPAAAPGGKRRAAQSDGAPVAKRAKRGAEPEALPGFTPPSGQTTAFEPSARVRRTDVTSKASYMDKRCDKCDGLTVAECLGLTYRNASGEQTKYNAGDLRYDVKAGRLVVDAATASHKVKKPALVAAAPSLAAACSPAAATSLASGVRLRSGSLLPVVGFGTYKLKNDAVAKPVLGALKAGYRLIDTAQVYENERGIGEALRKSGLARGDVFLETKVWRSSHGYERTMKAFAKSLRNLGVSYLDLYVIHWPGPKSGWPLPRGTLCPKDWTPAMRDKGTWRAMEDLYEQGKVKAIGVTNYSVRHLKQLLKVCRVKPMVNQVEFHPRLVQSELLKFCQQHGIAVQAYASLGSGDAAQAESFFAFPPVQTAAKAHKVTPAQVLLRWALQKGCHVVPKSVRPERIAENGQIFGFKLTAGEMRAIDGLHTGQRYAWKGLDPDTVK